MGMFTFAVSYKQSERNFKIVGYADFGVNHNVCTVFFFTSGDSMKNSNNTYFSTKDKDHDHYKENCAKVFNSAGWFSSVCFYTNLNGEYRKNSRVDAKELCWYHWGNTWRSLKSAKMMIRQL